MAGIDIKGQMGKEIAAKILASELSQKAAETAVAERAVDKLRKEIAKLAPAVA